MRRTERGQGSDPSEGLNRAIQRTIFGAVIIAGIVLFVLWRTDNPRVEQMRLTLMDAVLPSMGWVTEPLAVMTEIARDYEAVVDIYEQNRALRREIQRLHAWRETARQLEEENAQLRALNNLNQPPRTTFVTGDIIADSGGPFRESALVNVGARDGVVDGSAAVDGVGLVGRVSGVGERASRILLLTDFSSRIPVILKPRGRRAVLAGDGTPAPRLEFLDASEQVKPGDLVKTSGDGGVFPPDIPVGRVIVTPSQEWRVVLLSDYSRLEFVRLLRYRPDTRIDRPGGLVLPDGAARDPRPAERLGAGGTGRPPALTE
ncbi:rod shape-determining protein MreC [Paralimibaculum aggregatum]|uniref:Cell shape-determining protein MreC n=1 Tax=Paralimibaculum aggregatum TaxID=3036245 RepID=A0ABQ6LLN3_9RHOB|nr:rod shape-determining protein MreC [Limibaculum sp. NKW23]GMG84108.1 rod shape-determining protein MreC [Limibaculum sp. NKW23]